MLLFLGNLRRYKGVEALIATFGRLDRPGTTLVIAGQPFDQHIADDLAARAAGRPDVIVRPDYVPDRLLTTYLRAADAVVCPFTGSLTSGSVALALSFGTPCVAPRIGCIPAMVGEDDELLYDANEPDGLLTALRRAVDAGERLVDIGRCHQARMLGCGWDAIGRATKAAYQRAMTG